MHDVEPHLYTTVIREMIRHENDVTNHRIMWLLIGQGLMRHCLRLETWIILVLAILLVGVMLASLCIVWVWRESKDEGEL